MAREIIFRWRRGDVGTELEGRTVLMAGSFIIGSYRNDGIPHPECLLPGATLEYGVCFTQTHAKVKIEDAVERWFAEVVPNG